MKRIVVALLLLISSDAARAEFNVVEASIADMQQAMASGRVTSRELVQQYLMRIAIYENKLNAVITVNPNALREAEERDRERAQGRLRGPLHGIPIALKDNIHTTDMPTTGGALAFEGFVPPYEATLVKNLRDAGAIIIAKTSMTELANWVAGAPTPMPGNYNAVSGYGMNPYDPRRDPREAHDRRPPRADARRFELRHRHGGEFLGRECRHRDVGLAPQPRQPDHAGRDQADGRPHQPLRHHSDHRRPGHRRADGEDGHRRGHPARRARECRSPTRTIRPRPARRRRTATTRAFSIATRSRARASAFRAPSTTSRSRRPA